MASPYDQALKWFLDQWTQQQRQQQGLMSGGFAPGEYYPNSPPPHQPRSGPGWEISTPEPYPGQGGWPTGGPEPYTEQGAWSGGDGSNDQPGYEPPYVDPYASPGGGFGPQAPGYAASRSRTPDPVALAGYAEYRDRPMGVTTRPPSIGGQEVPQIGPGEPYPGQPPSSQPTRRKPYVPTPFPWDESGMPTGPQPGDLETLPSSTETGY